MRGFMVAIFAMGVLRFVLTVSGIPDSTVKYFSMTAVVSAGILFFAAATQTHKERLIASYLLILPYMIVEVAALSYTWISGRQTIFHTHEYSLGFSLPIHTIGHFIGGLTWEPVGVFLLMEVLWVMVWCIRRVIPAAT